MLNIIDLEGNGEIIEASVSKSFGLTDMYRDVHGAKKQHWLEDQLARLESGAGQVLACIRKSFEAGKKQTWMSRKDRDTIRKFLFIMKYRGTIFHRRFQHETFEDYWADDKEQMVEYAMKKGFKRPIDVWFDNLRVILELEMDPAGNWMREIQERMYPPDALWAISHLEGMYMTVCTPQDAAAEFLLSENLFSIFEGPSDIQFDPETGNETQMAYTEYHALATISPRLMIVLRSALLPNEIEDMIPEVSETRTLLDRMNRNLHLDPESARSILEDLPVHKPENSYTSLVNGRLELKAREDGSRKAHHEFGFKFFGLRARHVNALNRVILEQIPGTAGLCFSSRPALRAILEWYLSSRPEDQAPYSFKRFTGPEDVGLETLKKLENTARLLGSDVQAIYRLHGVREIEMRISESIEANIQSGRHEYPMLDTYVSLGLQSPLLLLSLLLADFSGGSGSTWHKDMTQVHKMRYLRIQIDVSTKGMDENVRSSIRENLVELYCKVPSRRIYLYTKNIRFMKLVGGSKIENMCRDSGGDMPGRQHENAIGQAASLFRPEQLNRALYATAMQDIQIAINERNLRSVTVDRALWARSAIDLAFNYQGSVCKCGIDIIKEAAIKACRYTLTFGQVDRIGARFLTGEQNVELMTRAIVRAQFMDLLDGQLPIDKLRALKEAMFTTAYPIEFLPAQAK